MSRNVEDRTWVDAGHEKAIARLSKRKWFTTGGDHDTVIVAVGGLVVPVDVKLAETMYLLWKLGVETQACCEDSIGSRMADKGMRVCVTEAELEWNAKSGPWAYIAFPGVVHLQVFADLVAPAVCREGDQRWLFSAWPVDEEATLAGKVQFPQGHIPAVVGELRSRYAVLAELEEYRRRFGPMASGDVDV